MKKIGIITYHSAYNFGSVLQAYATLKKVKSFNANSEIINYRIPKQYEYYSLYNFKTLKSFIKSLMLIPFHKLRKRRQSKFEIFIRNNLDLSLEVNSPNEVYALYDNYDFLISGSDQIWNKHSNELANSGWDYMGPYLLRNFDGKKISYASSISNMTQEDLEKIKPDLLTFNEISIRESSSKIILENLLNHNVTEVCDPTFLLTKEEWIRDFDLKKDEECILIYYLSMSLKEKNNIKKIALKLSKRLNCKIKLITPFLCYYFLGNDIIRCDDYGPIEFLNSIYNSKYIITNSYHGLLFSINFKKNFYCICKNSGSEFRKTDVLTRLKLENRVINKLDEALLKNFDEIDYDDELNSNIDQFRQMGEQYLKLNIL